MPYKKGELPHGGHGSDARTLQEWRASEPLVDAWLSKKRPGTARKYGEDFRAYWLDRLSQRYKSIEEWLDAVKKAQYEPDFEVQTAARGQGPRTLSALIVKPVVAVGCNT